MSSFQMNAVLFHHNYIRIVAASFNVIVIISALRFINVNGDVDAESGRGRHRRRKQGVHLFTRT